MPEYPSSVNRFVTKRFLDQAAISQIIDDLPRFTKSIPITLPDNFPAIFREKMREGEVTPVLVSSHTSHMDAAPLGALTQKLTTMSADFLGGHRMEGFVIPIATSMKTGHQGSTVKEATDRMQEFMEKQFNITSVFYTREKDRMTYGLDTHNNSIAAMLHLVRLVKKGYGIAVFPEGTMQAGRTKKRGLLHIERYGMQKFQEIEAFVEIARLAKKKPLFIPVGIDGGYRLESPDNNKLTPAYLMEVFFAHPPETQLVSVKVDTPIFLEEIGDADINHFLGKKVAELLPPEARGVYA